MGSSIAKTARVTSSASLPSVSGDKPSTAGLLAFTLQKTAEKKEISLNKESLSIQASLKASNKEKAASDKATPFESGKGQSRHSLPSENATPNFSTSTALDLTPPDDKLPVVVSASIAANYVTVLLDSPSALPSKLTDFREPSPSVDTVSVSRNLYSTSSVVPVWTANMLGNAYGGGYIITPSIFVTSFPDSPSSSGIPPGYELASQSEDNQSFRSPTRASLGTGGVLTLLAGPIKEEATPGVSTSASALDALIDLSTTEIHAASSTQIPSTASNHNLLKPVAVTKPSLASNIPAGETSMLNTSLLLPSASVNLAHLPLISPFVNQSVISAYSPTSGLEFQGFAFKETFNYSLGLTCIMALALFFIL